MASRMTIIRGSIIVHRQPEISVTGVHGYTSNLSRENRFREEREKKMTGLCSGFGKRLAAERKDPRHLSGRLSLFCRSASGYSPHVVLGQEVRLRSGRNLSRGATLSSISFPPFLSTRFYFVPPFSGGWRAKGFRPADEANEFGSARCTLFGAKGSVGGK